MIIVKPIKKQKRNFRGNILKILDSTDKKIAEDKISWNELLLDSISYNSQLAYLVVDTATEEILYFNNKFLEMWYLNDYKFEFNNKTFRYNKLIHYLDKFIKERPGISSGIKLFDKRLNGIKIENEIKLQRSAEHTSELQSPYV